MALINPYIFREYDIRGKVKEDFPQHVVEKLGKAFGTFVRRAGGREIALSGDIRLTTPDLMKFSTSFRIIFGLLMILCSSTKSIFPFDFNSFLYFF